jgi:hypothetical protein
MGHYVGECFGTFLRGLAVACLDSEDGRSTSLTPWQRYMSMASCWRIERDQEFRDLAYYTFTLVSLSTKHFIRHHFAYTTQSSVSYRSLGQYLYH